VWVCDRENHRIQIFDTDGNYLDEWTGLLRPMQIHFDPIDDVVYITELMYQVSVRGLDGRVITKWGGNQESDEPGMFRGWPHGVCVDSHGDLYVSEVKVDGRIQKYIRQGGGG
jgi:sugar lactone lactonase YvrE